MEEHRKYNQLAFSDIQIVPFKDRKLRSYINQYYTSLSWIEFNLKDLNIYQESQYSSENIQNSIAIIIEDNKEIIKEIISSYNQIIKESIAFYKKRKDFKLQGVNIFNFLSKSSNLFFKWKGFNPELLLTSISTSNNIISLLYNIYEYFSRDKNNSAFYFTSKGCKILNLTWYRIFRDAYHNIRLPATIIKYVTSAINSPISLQKQFIDKTIGRYVAYAEYSYNFQTDKNSHYIIHGLNLSQSHLKQIYNKALGKLSFPESIGLSAALFKCKGGSQYCLSFAGTRLKNGWKVCLANIITDITQYIFGPDTAYVTAVGLLSCIQNKLNGKNIIVTGHSLGGGLTQFSIACVGNNTTHGICFNPAGLSKKSLQEAKKCDNKSMQNIRLICSSTDLVSRIGNFFGKKEYILINKCMSHSLDDLNKELNGTKKQVNMENPYKYIDFS